MIWALKRLVMRLVVWLVVRRSTLLFAPNALVNLFSMYSNALGRVDTYPYLVPLNPQYSNRHFVSDHHGFTDPSRENQHSANLPIVSERCELFEYVSEPTPRNPRPFMTLF